MEFTEYGFPPDYLDEISSAVQKNDIRDLIEEGLIKAKPIKGTSRARARKADAQRAKGRRKGQGSRREAPTRGTPRSTAG
ncbi:MAG: hypothetical protein CM1200mP21_08750 [Candidatus Poseidoniales archaeon]|nr:MAG: hypothetical protein CM1200mP21_08750 [Candidatus Poseidoniales archaeon]